jgi:hypothetical protein
MKLTTELANALYDIAVEECGAREDNRAEFLRYVLGDATDYDQKRFEYRFQGALGFGGKLYIDFRYEDYCKISCYSEDRNEVRNAMIQKANDRIKALLRQKSIVTPEDID